MAQIEMSEADIDMDIESLDKLENLSEVVENLNNNIDVVNSKVKDVSSKASVVEAQNQDNSKTTKEQSEAIKEFKEASKEIGNIKNIDKKVEARDKNITEVVNTFESNVETLVATGVKSLDDTLLTNVNKFNENAKSKDNVLNDTYSDLLSEANSTKDNIENTSNKAILTSNGIKRYLTIALGVSIATIVVIGYQTSNNIDTSIKLSKENDRANMDNYLTIKDSQIIQAKNTEDRDLTIFQLQSELSKSKEDLMSMGNDFNEILKSQKENTDQRIFALLEYIDNNSNVKSETPHQVEFKEPKREGGRAINIVYQEQKSPDFSREEPQAIEVAPNRNNIYRCYDRDFDYCVGFLYEKDKLYFVDNAHNIYDKNKNLIGSL